MIKRSMWGRRVFKHGLVLTTSLLTCALVQAGDHEPGSKDAAFIQKALKSGQMEVQMGQTAQQKAQAQTVKDLGAVLVRDHSKVNQRLQQIASARNWTLDNTDVIKSRGAIPENNASDRKSVPEIASSDTDKHASHQAEINKLQTQSGQEFDKTFVSMMLKSHKKGIAAYEKARSEVSDTELRSVIDETLPTLREHLQLAQNAARTLGVDESKIAADGDVDRGAAGAPAAGVSGTRGSELQPQYQERSNLDQNNPYDRAATPEASSPIQQNRPPVDANANLDDTRISEVPSSSASRVNEPSTFVPEPGSSYDNAHVPTDINTSSTVAVDSTQKSKFFQKGDNKVLGLSTDKNDGKFWGIIPNWRKK